MNSSNIGKKDMSSVSHYPQINDRLYLSYPWLEEREKKALSIIKNFVRSIEKNLLLRKNMLIGKILDKINNSQPDIQTIHYTNECSGKTNSKTRKTGKFKEYDPSDLTPCNNQYEKSGQIGINNITKSSSSTCNINKENDFLKKEINLEGDEINQFKIENELKRRSKFLFKRFLIFLYFKKFLLLRHICDLKAKSSTKLQSSYRMWTLRKKIINLFEMDKSCFMIKCKIKSAQKVQLRVFMKEKIERMLEFHLCPFREEYVLYVEKNLVQRKKYFVNFIVDGNTIIDPLYTSDYDKDGNFYNIIDFAKLEEEKREKEYDKLENDYFYSSAFCDLTERRSLKTSNQENDKEINIETTFLDCSDFQSQKKDSRLDIYKIDHCNLEKVCLNNNDSLSSVENCNEYKTHKKKKKTFTTDCNLINLQQRNSIVFSSSANKKSSFNINKSGIKQNFSQANLVMPKPILKTPSNCSKPTIPKRVSFGNVHFSSN